MKTAFVWTLTTVMGALAFGSQMPAFDDYFLDQTLRVDYFQTGDADEIIVSIDQIYQQDVWAGNPEAPIDTLNRGLYYVKVVDINSNAVIYTRGFSNLFGEYRTTDEAKVGIMKTFHHSVLIPRPKRPFLFVLEGRDRTNLLVPIYQTRIDPDDQNIIRQAPSPDDRVVSVLANGHPHDKIDLLFVAEGYTAEQWEKFCSDVKRFADVMFATEPCPPNITALLDRGNVKWKHLLSPGIPVPTPAQYHRLAGPRQRQVEAPALAGHTGSHARRAR